MFDRLVAGDFTAPGPTQKDFAWNSRHCFRDNRSERSDASVRTLWPEPSIGAAE